MNEPFTFYRALDPVKGSWDGYGYFSLGDSDFLAFVADAPSGASIHTPELIKNFWTDYCRNRTSGDPDQSKMELADGINRLQNYLQKKSRQDGSSYQATLSLALKIGSQLLYCSIGDSVLQLLRNSKLYRLTANEVWDGSLIVEENQNLKERQKTQTLRFVGNGGNFLELSEILSVELKQGDILIFCTDGIEDLLSPAQLIPLLKTNPEILRKELERIFAQDKIKDDATFLAVKLRVPAVFDSEKETGRLRSQIEGLQKEQTQFRNDLTRLALPYGRLEKIEKALQDISQQVQALGKKLDHVKPRESLTMIRQKPRMHWPAILIAFLIGLAAGIGFLSLTKNTANPPIPAHSTPAPTKSRITAPPEIVASQECSYEVQKGDSLEKIAAKKNVSLENLLLLNPSLKKETSLQVGQRIVLCGDMP